MVGSIGETLAVVGSTVAVCAPIALLIAYNWIEGRISSMAKTCESTDKISMDFNSIPSKLDLVGKRISELFDKVHDCEMRVSKFDSSYDAIHKMLAEETDRRSQALSEIRDSINSQLSHSADSIVSAKRIELGTRLDELLVKANTIINERLELVVSSDNLIMQLVSAINRSQLNQRGISSGEDSGHRQYNPYKRRF